MSNVTTSDPGFISIMDPWPSSSPKLSQGCKSSFRGTVLIVTSSTKRDQLLLTLSPSWVLWPRVISDLHRVTTPLGIQWWSIADYPMLTPVSVPRTALFVISMQTQSSTKVSCSTSIWAFIAAKQAILKTEKVADDAIPEGLSKTTGLVRVIGYSEFRCGRTRRYVCGGLSSSESWKTVILTLHSTKWSCTCRSC